MKKSSVAKAIGFSASSVAWLFQASSVLAQTASTSSAELSKGGTNGALPNAGSTELTYFIFIGGAALFVLGALKLALSFRD